MQGGDISTNPGPVTKSNKQGNPKCEQCEKEITKNSKKVQCEKCKYIWHLKCASLTVKTYNKLANRWIDM